jgi:hypothetical protein
VAAVLAVGLTVHEASTPAAYWVIPLWALSMGYVAWMYWTGLRVNQWASREGGRWWQLPAVLALIPVFSALEGYAAFRGLLYAISRRPVVFTVIGKEA